jgi:hypothetical protein
MRAIVRVRLSPCVQGATFEQLLRATPAVLSAALVTGDADYEIQLCCCGFADFGDELARICGWPGVVVESTALVLHEVTGLGQDRPVVPQAVTFPRLRAM